MKFHKWMSVPGVLAFTWIALTLSVSADVPHQINSGAQVVTFWNLTGNNAILATPLGPRATPLASRAMAMMHVAMADAVFSLGLARHDLAVIDPDSATPRISIESQYSIRRRSRYPQALLRLGRPTGDVDVSGIWMQAGHLSCRSDVRHLDDFKELSGLARIYGGIHYRNTVEVSWAQGEAIAQHVIENFYRHHAAQ
jgi:hypothetical protein